MLFCVGFLVGLAGIAFSTYIGYCFGQRESQTATRVIQITFSGPLTPEEQAAEVKAVRDRLALAGIETTQL